MTLRTGQQYLASLRDSRTIYVDGQRVHDVTQDRRFQGAAQTIASLYDLQHAPQHQDTLTYVDEQGRRANRSFQQPRSVDDLVARAKANKLTMDTVHGMMGRAPDFLNVVVAGLAAAHTVFDESPNSREFGRNVVNYYEHVRNNDLALTHVLVNPQVDRSKALWEQEPGKDIALKVVRETDAGFYVQGCRLVGTLAQLANEILVMPSTVVPSHPKAADYSLGFAIPLDADGVKMISRPTVVPQQVASLLDHPVSLRMDEGDALMVFDNVFVPWERTFIYRDPELCNKVMTKTYAYAHATHQAMIRTLAKAEFMCALASELARSTRVDSFPNVQNELADHYMYVELIAAALFKAERTAVATPFGTLAPDTTVLHAIQINFHLHFNQMVDTIRTLGGGALVGVPSYAELEGEAGDLVRQYLVSGELEAEQRIRLCRLASDVSMSDFSGRQQAYERYYQGDPFRVRQAYFSRHPRRASFQALIQDVLDSQLALARGQR
jgi:4-hydroxyphenylacetate 3-monooxygenase